MTIRETLEAAGIVCAPYGDAPEMPVELADFNPADVSADYDFNATQSAELLLPLDVEPVELFDEDDEE